MKSRLFVLVLVLVLVLSILAAAPIDAAYFHSTTFRDFVATPCAPGAAYNPTCDVNQDGSVNVLDIQLTAGHWNQTGTWTSGDGWLLTGNAGTNPAQNYIGTTDGQPLVLQPAGGRVGIGTNSPQSRLNVVGTSWFQGDNTPLPAAAGKGIAIGFAGEQGYIYGFDYSTFTPQNLLLQNPGGRVAIGTTTPAQAKLSISAGVGEHAVYTNSPGGAGLYIFAADIGVDTTGSLLAGYFRGNIVVEGYCVGCLQANFAVNAGDDALQPGDVVSIQAVTSTNFDTGPNLWQVVSAQAGQAVVGVAAGRAELVVEEEHRPTETGKRLVPRDGAAQPGEYVTIVYSGPMQVKVAPGESVIAAGTRLTAAVDGSVRPLQTRTMEGMVVTEGAPVIGVALERAKNGMVWVLVNPQ